MSSVVHYRFKCLKAHEVMLFDGPYVSVKELKKFINEKKRIGSTSTSELQISKEQTGEGLYSLSHLMQLNVRYHFIQFNCIQKFACIKKKHILLPVYDDDDALIPRFVSVLVSRVPVAEKQKRTYRNEKKIAFGSDLKFDKHLSMADLTKMKGTEQTKIRTMIAQSTHEYHPAK